MKFDIYDQKGKKLKGKVDLDTTVFEKEVDPYLLNLAVRIYLDNQRQATAHTQKRGEVRGGGAKPWAQKGTGRARHGSIRSPIWKGGGVTFGPRKNRNFKRKLNKSMKKNAIRGVFSLFAKEGELVIVDKIDIKNSRLTNEVVQIVSKLPTKEKVLFIHSGGNRNLYLGSRNLQKVNAIAVNEINVYDLLLHSTLVIESSALEQIENYWSEKEKPSAGKKQPKRKKVLKETKPEKQQVKKKGNKVDIEELKLGTRIENALKEEDIQTKEQLKKYVVEERIGQVSGIGEKSVKKIKKVLGE